MAFTLPSILSTRPLAALLLLVTATTLAWADEVTFFVENNMYTYECDVTISDAGNGVAHAVLATDGDSLEQTLGADPDDAWFNHAWLATFQQDYLNPNSPLISFDPRLGFDPRPQANGGRAITNYQWEVDFDGFSLTIDFDNGAQTVPAFMFDWTGSP